MSPRVPSSATTTPREAFWRHFSMNASCSKSIMAAGTTPSLLVP
jgi:hypothetical protein